MSVASLLNSGALFCLIHPAGTLVITARHLKLRKGNVFTGVCLFTWGSTFLQCHVQAHPLPTTADPLLRQTFLPPKADPSLRRQTLLCPKADPITPPPLYGQQVNGTRPTGMHTCFCLRIIISVNSVSCLQCKSVGISGVFFTHAASPSVLDKLILLSQNFPFERINSLQCYELTRRYSHLLFTQISPLTCAVYL